MSKGHEVVMRERRADGCKEGGEESHRKEGRKEGTCQEVCEEGSKEEEVATNPKGSRTIREPFLLTSTQIPLEPVTYDAAAFR